MSLTIERGRTKLNKLGQTTVKYKIVRAALKLQVPLELGNYQHFTRFRYVLKHQKTRVVFILFPHFEPENYTKVILYYPYLLKRDGSETEDGRDIFIFMMNRTHAWDGIDTMYRPEYRCFTPFYIFLVSFHQPNELGKPIIEIQMHTLYCSTGTPDTLPFLYESYSLPDADCMITIATTDGSDGLQVLN